MKNIDIEETVKTADLTKLSLEEIEKYAEDINESLKFYKEILDEDNVLLEVLEYQKNDIERYLKDIK